MGYSHSSWKMVSGPSVGRTGNVLLLPRVTLDKLFWGSKGKAAEEGWGGKLVKLAFHSVCSSLEVVPQDHAHCAENRKEKSQRKQEM